MASAALSTGDPRVAPPEIESREQFIRGIVADSQAVFRAGLRKIFAGEDDIRVVGQAETVEPAISAAKKFSAEILIFEAALGSIRVGGQIVSVMAILRQLRRRALSGECRHARFVRPIVDSHGTFFASSFKTGSVFVPQEGEGFAPNVPFVRHFVRVSQSDNQEAVIVAFLFNLSNVTVSDRPIR